MAVVLAMSVGVAFSFVTRSVWVAERDLKIAAGTALAAAGAAPGDVVMSLDTGGVKYWTGHPGVVAPADPIATIQAVAKAYDARWLLVERRDTVDGPGSPPRGRRRHPAWIGPSVWREPRPARIRTRRSAVDDAPSSRSASPPAIRGARHDRP